MTDSAVVSIPEKNELLLADSERWQISVQIVSQPNVASAFVTQCLEWFGIGGVGAIGWILLTFRESQVSSFPLFSLSGKLL